MAEYMTLKEIAELTSYNLNTIQHKARELGLVQHGKETQLDEEQTYRLIQEIVLGHIPVKARLFLQKVQEGTVAKLARADFGHNEDKNVTITEGKAVARWLKITLTLLEAGTLQGCETAVVRIIDKLGLTTTPLDDEEKVRAIVDCHRLCIEHKMKEVAADDK